MIGELLGAVTDIVGMIGADSARDDYNARIDELKKQNKLSQSALQAKALLAENATRGLAGYDTMKEDIYNQTPTTLNQARDFLSGGGVVDFLARSKASTDQQLRALNAQNDQARWNNMNMYANYLGGAMAGQENRQNAINTGLSMNQANMDYQTAAAQNALGGALAGRMGGLGDQDWTKLVALLSKPRIPSAAELYPTTPRYATFE